MANELYIQPSANAYVGFNCPEDTTYTPDKALSYSLDGSTWTATTVSALQSSYIAVGANQKIYFKSDNDTPLWSDSTVYTSFCVSATNSSSGTPVLFKVGGRLPSLFNNNEQALMAGAFAYSSVSDASELILPATTLSTTNCYRAMFWQCGNLTETPILPATTLSENCYYSMFNTCTSLVETPVLPATQLSAYCYRSMFTNCSSLKIAHDLPATKLYDYSYGLMFQGCTSLVVPPEMCAVDAWCVRACVQMFYGCTALEVSPELRIIDAGDRCYQYMFSGCSSLRSVPRIDLKTPGVGSCYNMFQNCVSLVSTPDLNVTSLSQQCFDNMFRGCTSLIKIARVPEDIMRTYVPPYCFRSMYHTCSSLNEVQPLPATTVSTGSYEFMYNNCTSLTKIPALPALDLSATEECYHSLFKGCTSLKFSTTQTAECPNAYRIPVEGTGTIGTTSLDNMFYGTSGPYTDNPSMNTTYYTNATIIYGGYTDILEQNLIINHLTLAQYQSITPDPHQLYIIDDGLEYETVNNKVTSLSVEVTEDNYPSARAVYNAVVAAQTESADSKEY